MDSSTLGLVTVLAAFLSPLIAVQVSQWLERSRARRDQQLRIFQTLMSTRAAIVDSRHVEALNSIDVVFGANSRVETAIRNQWKRYLDHLNTPMSDQEIWLQRQVEHLVDLLHPMAQHLGFEFDKVHLKNQTYLPQRHAWLENEQDVIRRGLVELLSGQRPLSVAIDATDTPDLRDSLPVAASRVPDGAPRSRRQAR